MTWWYLEYDCAKACEIGLGDGNVGYVCEEPRRELFQYMDAVNIDLKPSLTSFAKNRWRGSPSIKATSLNMKAMPGNHPLYRGKMTNEEITAMSKWLVANLGPDVPALQPFTLIIKCNNTPAPASTLHRARQIPMLVCIMSTPATSMIWMVTALSAGCQTPLIERDWYQLRSYQLNIAPVKLCAADPRSFPEKLNFWR